MERLRRNIDNMIIKQGVYDLFHCAVFGKLIRQHFSLHTKRKLMIHTENSLQIHS